MFFDSHRLEGFIFEHVTPFWALNVSSKPISRFLFFKNLNRMWSQILLTYCSIMARHAQVPSYSATIRLEFLYIMSYSSFCNCLYMFMVAFSWCPGCRSCFGLYCWRCSWSKNTRDLCLRYTVHSFPLKYPELFLYNSNLYLEIAFLPKLRYGDWIFVVASCTSFTVKTC